MELAPGVRERIVLTRNETIAGVPQERIQERSSTSWFLQVTEETFEGVQIMPQERVQNRAVEQFVDVPGSTELGENC